MAIADYLRKLVEMKNQLVANLNSMGVAADESEKLNTLVPKVLECEGKQNVEFVEGTDFTGTSSKAGFITAISKINTPNNITSIGDYAFYCCDWLTDVTLSDSVTSTGRLTFGYCTSLTDVTLSDSLTSTGKQTFFGCTSLTDITLPDSVTSTGEQTFYGCTSLKSIIIPDSVTSIGRQTFAECTSLANIYYTGTKEQWNAITKGEYWNSNMGSNVSGGTKIHYNYVPE